MTNNIGFGSSEFIVLRTLERIIPELVYRFVSSEKFREIGKPQMTGTGGLQRLPTSFISKFQIPLPPIEVQHEIVAELDIYQKIIDGARQVVENYTPTINIDPTWEEAELRSIADLLNGYAFNSTDYVPFSNVLNFRMSNIRPNGEVDINYNPKYLPDNFLDKYKDYLLHDGDVVIAMTDMASAPKILGVPTIVKTQGRKLLLNQRVGKFINLDEKKIYVPFLKYILNREAVKNYYKTLGGGGLQINISKSDILSILIPLPSLDMQKHIVSKLEEERKLIEANKKLIEIFEQKIKDKIAEVWGENPSVEPVETASSNGTIKQAPQVQLDEIEQAELGSV